MYQTTIYDPTDHTTVGDGEPVVLLPGLFAGEWIWDGVRETLRARGFRVITLRHPLAVFGKGLRGVEDLRRQLMRLLDDLGIVSASFVANSLGGLVALDLARVSPESVRALVLSGTPGLGEADLGMGFPRNQDEEFARRLLPKLFHNPVSVPAEAISKIVHMLSRRRYFLNYARLLQSSRSYDIRGTLAELRCPTLLCWGRNDGVTPLGPWEAEFPRIPNGRLHVVEECGHSPMIEKPEEFARVVIEFLQGAAVPA